MLDNIVYWYILPGITLTMLFTLGFGIVGRLKPIMKMAAFNVVLAVVTYFLNKRAVNKELVPRLAKIEELINVMEKA